jgi:hypothetical protein
MAAPNSQAAVKGQKNTLTVGDSWRCNYTSKSRDKKEQLVFEIKQVDDKAIEEVIKLKLDKESGFEDQRALQRGISLEGFLPQNRFDLVIFLGS